MSAATLQTNEQTTSPASAHGSVRTVGTKGAIPAAKAWSTALASITDVNRRAADSTEESEVHFEPLSPPFVGAHSEAGGDHSVRATVLKVQDDLVTSEVTLGNRTWEVALPRVLFKSPVEYGTPVRIGIKDVDGYRTPVVEVLATVPTQDDEIERLRAELLAL